MLVGRDCEHSSTGSSSRDSLSDVTRVHRVDSVTAWSHRIQDEMTFGIGSGGASVRRGLSRREAPCSDVDCSQGLAGNRINNGPGYHRSGWRSLAVLTVCDRRKNGHTSQDVDREFCCPMLHKHTKTVVYIQNAGSGFEATILWLQNPAVSRFLKNVVDCRPRRSGSCRA